MPDRAWWESVFRTIDGKDVPGFLAFLAPDAEFRFANNPPAHGHEQIGAVVGGFLGAIGGSRPRFVHAWEDADTAACEGEASRGLAGTDRRPDRGLLHRSERSRPAGRNDWPASRLGAQRLPCAGGAAQRGHLPSDAARVPQFHPGDFPDGGRLDGRHQADLGTRRGSRYVREPGVIRPLLDWETGIVEGA